MRMAARRTLPRPQLLALPVHLLVPAASPPMPATRQILGRVGATAGGLGADLAPPAPRNGRSRRRAPPPHAACRAARARARRGLPRAPPISIHLSAHPFYARFFTKRPGHRRWRLPQAAAAVSASVAPSAVANGDGDGVGQKTVVFTGGGSSAVAGRSSGAYRGQAVDCNAILQGFRKLMLSRQSL